MVLLFSTRKRKSGQVVALGSLISRDSTHVIGGTVLGDGYFAVAIHSLNDVEDERLPRPYEDLTTVEDALGKCVAWPCTHVSSVSTFHFGQIFSLMLIWQTLLVICRLRG